MQSAWWLGVHLKNHRKPRAAPQISTLAVPDHHIMASPNTMGRWNFTWAVGSNFQGMFLTAGTESLLDNISLLNIWAPSFHIGKCKLDGKQGKMQGSKTLCKGRIPPVRERLFASDWWRGGLKRAECQNVNSLPRHNDRSPVSSGRRLVPKRVQKEKHRGHS